MSALFKQKGFTLIEGLISLVLMSVGLLGAGYLQLYMHTSAAQVIYRATATDLVNDLISRAMMDSSNLGCYTLNSPSPANIHGVSSTCGSTAAQTFMTAWTARVNDQKKLPSAGSNYTNSVSINSSGVMTIVLQWDIPRDSATGTFNVPHRHIVVMQIP